MWPQMRVPLKPPQAKEEKPDEEEEEGAGRRIFPAVGLLIPWMDIILSNNFL